MTSAKQFATSLAEAGPNAKFSKYDLVDAYKNVPVQIKDLRLQGFCWLEKYFVETRQIFGAKTAVPNYDILGNTLLTLANVTANVPKKFLHRALDDVPVISPSCKNYCDLFDKSYTELCSYLNVKLAEPCKKFEKAFAKVTYGKVLGYFFDSKSMSWKLPEEKRAKYRNFAVEILMKRSCNLLEMQTLMGYLNYAGMFSVFLKGMKFNLNKALGYLQSHCDKILLLNDDCLFELRVWANFLCDESWQPLAVHYSPPLYYKNFASDAAGWNSGKNLSENVGCGSVGFDGSGRITFANQFFWPTPFMRWDGAKYGSKTTTLEFIGAMVPFLLIPERLVNEYIVIRVDNVGCFFSWVNRQASGDETTSIFVRALHMIASVMACDIHIEHLPRVSNWEAMTVDRLSREATTSDQDRRLLRSFRNRSLPECLLRWFQNPEPNWNLCIELLNHVRNILDK
jgi:hypothetical protein